MAESGTIQSLNPTPSSRVDNGATFIEILVSVVILGIAGIAVLVGMAAALRGAATHDRLATVQANLSDAGDHLTDVTFDNDTYVPCATPTDYDAEIAVWQVVVTNVEFWNGTVWGTCDPSRNEMQKVTLQASVDDLQRELVVVKRKATTAVTPGGAWDDSIVTPEKHPNL